MHHRYTSEECISEVEPSVANVIYLRCIVVVVMYLENDENDHNGPQKPSAKSFPVGQTSKIIFSKHVLGSGFIGGSVKGLPSYDPSYGSSRVVSCRQLAFFLPRQFLVFLYFLRYLWNGSSKLQMSILELVALGISYRMVTEFTRIGTAVVKKLLALSSGSPPPRAKWRTSSPLD